MDERPRQPCLLDVIAGNWHKLLPAAADRRRWLRQQRRGRPARQTGTNQRTGYHDSYQDQKR
ncbi:MAG: hypothetical protein R2712_10940 [Vicinamibacterales bacterium]